MGYNNGKKIKTQKNEWRKSNMKKAIWKKVFAIGLLFVILTSIAGCGTNKGDDGVVKDDTKYPETLKIFCSAPSAVVMDGFDQNEVLGFKLMEKHTGTHVEWTHPPANGLSEKFNLMIASGNLPDLIAYYWDGVQGGAKSFYEEDVILELSDLVKDNMPNLSKFLDERPDVRKQMSNDENDIFYIPFIRKDKELGVYLGPLLREDWVKKLGLSIPKTTDELYEVLKAFKTGDPNGNGEADEIPMVGTGFDNSMFGIGNLAWAFGTHYGFYLDEGKVKYGIMEDEFEDALRYINKLYSEGLIDIDYMITDRSKLDSKAKSDKAGFLFGFQPSIYQREMDDGVKKFTGIPHLKGPDGDHNYYVSSYANPVTSASIAITTANKYPEATMRWLDEFFGEPGLTFMNFGEEGLSFKMTDGNPILTDHILNNPNGKSVNDMLQFSIAAHNSNFPTLQDWRYYKQYLSEWGIEAVENWTESADISGILPPLSFTPEEDETNTQIMAQVSAFVSEEINKMVIGITPIDDIDAIREKVKKMGIEQVLGIYNDAYSRYMKK